MRVPRGPKYRTLVSQVRCEGDRNHHQASRQFQYPITPGVGDPCWDSNPGLTSRSQVSLVMIRHAVPRCAMLSHAVPCCATQCHAAQRCTILCASPCAVVSCAVYDVLHMHRPCPPTTSLSSQPMPPHCPNGSVWVPRALTASWGHCCQPATH